MYLYLRQHPEIYVSVLKEPQFFGRDLTPPPQAIRDLDTYLSLFAGGAGRKRIGEASVWYLASRTAAAEIRALCPEARILLMLRNPVDMVRSLHSLYLRTGNEEIADLGEALAAEPERRQGRRVPASAYFPEGLCYTEIARYRAKVERFLDAFGPERVRVVLFDDFVADTARVYRETLAFLEVDPEFRAELSVEAATRLVREDALRQLRRVPPEVRARMVGAPARHRGEGSRPVPPELRERLWAELADDVEELARLLGRDLSRWRPVRALER